ncbi:hypothetical protein CYMTET_31238 [Cymbomonas tetramitiformis]|uniref:Uncharacterized protein n=1 Tax=Cymbomonas tetramitiformis TaxID=36881 RepID=A0AAE0FH69_9CHLO|nr:hypothetical protein CYMTET_31238 [Cymbomonas tetramitiformis]
MVETGPSLGAKFEAWDDGGDGSKPLGVGAVALLGMMVETGPSLCVGGGGSGLWDDGEFNQACVWGSVECQARDDGDWSKPVGG